MLNVVTSLNLPARMRHWRRGLVYGLLSVLALLVVLPYGLIVRAPLAQADAIVVFSGSSTYIERMEWAAQLWRAGRAPLIIVTYDFQSAGWDARRQRNPTFTERAVDVLRSQGVPADKIIVVHPGSYNTRGEAEAALDYARNQGLHSLLFVTSAYHTRRSWWTVRQVFANSGMILGIDAPPPGRETPPPWRWWSESIGWKLVPGEYLKFIYYWLRY